MPDEQTTRSESVRQAARLRDDLVSAVYQYRDDMRHPPAPDSVERRLAWIEEIIGRIQRDAQS